MIRFGDAITLAHTKLHTHKVRTGITIGIAGILFGILLAAVFVVQGVFDSVDSFSKEGLNDRALVVVSRYTQGYPVYEHLEDQDFIALVEQKHQENIDKKVAAAKKHGVPYDAATENPSPIQIDKETKTKHIDIRSMQHEAVVQAAEEREEQTFVPFDMDAYLKPYPSSHVLKDMVEKIGTEGDLIFYMKDGKEQQYLTQQQKIQAQYGGSQDTPTLSIMNQSIVDPFINASASFDATKGEVPAVIPFKSAEKLLDLKPLSKKATVQEKYDRLQDVRNRIGEQTADFCYRNAASQQLLQMALSQRDAKEESDKTLGVTYTPPPVQYSLPADDSCGAIEVVKDTRSAAQKKADANRVNFEKEIGEYIGEPVQYKITVRPVGISGGMPEGGATFDVGGMVQSMLGSWLGYGDAWTIPASMLREIPDDQSPDVLISALERRENINPFGGVTEGGMVEFDNFDEARQLLRGSGALEGRSGDIYVSPFGSSTLLLAEMKDMFAQVMLWALLAIGGVAIIILSSIIGRTVSEGRRESAVFRAIGARRLDIASIYGVYTLLLSVRVALFAVVLGLAVSLTLELLFTEQATLAARYAYAAADAAPSFHFFSFISWFVPLIVAAIILFGLLASVIPVIRSARRNPITDMRDDT